MMGAQVPLVLATRAEGAQAHVAFCALALVGPWLRGADLAKRNYN